MNVPGPNSLFEIENFTICVYAVWPSKLHVYIILYYISDLSFVFRTESERRQRDSLYPIEIPFKRSERVLLVIVALSFFSSNLLLIDDRLP